MEFDKLDPEFKAKWTAALRSGEYFQARGALKAIESPRIRHCCLGVACEVLYPELLREYPNGAPGTVPEDEFAPKVLHAVGLTSPAQHKLVSLNDSYRNTFSEIADWIDANL